MELDSAFFAPDFLTEFIKRFRSLPCLWKVKSNDYFNSTQRQKGWEELRDFCIKINPKADIKWIKKKVQNIRTSFRKELKKVTVSQKSGTGVEYKPKLWYFELLFFTKDDEVRESITSIDFDETACADNEEQDVNMEGVKVMPRLNDEDKPIKSEVLNLYGIEKKTATSLKRKNHDTKPGEEDFNFRKTLLLERIRIELEHQGQDDEYEATGKVVATKLRNIGNIDYKQFIYVDKIINDTLYKALLRQLTPADVIMSENKSQIPLVPIYNVSNGNIASSSSSDQSSVYSPPRPLLKVLLPEFH